MITLDVSDAGISAPTYKLKSFLLNRVVIISKN